MTELVSAQESRERIARRIAHEFNLMPPPLVVNLGVGIPTMVANYIASQDIFIQAENGMMGVGPKASEEKADRRLINAGREPVTETAGCSYFDSAASFGMIRGGHVDVTVIGAFEVDETGNIANWIIPNGRQLGVGGAMDLVSGARQVIVAMRHCSRDGKSKLVRSCSLPVTGFHEVDMVVTELGLFRFVKGALILEEIAPEITVDHLIRITEARFTVSADLKTMGG